MHLISSSVVTKWQFKQLPHSLNMWPFLCDVTPPPLLPKAWKEGMFRSGRLKVITRLQEEIIFEWTHQCYVNYWSAHVVFLQEFGCISLSFDSSLPMGREVLIADTKITMGWIYSLYIIKVATVICSPPLWFWLTRQVDFWYKNHS